MSSRVLVAALTVLLACGSAFADPAPEDQTARIRALIAELGSESWEARDRAYRALRKLGSAAHPLLEEAMKAPDLEVRRAAAKLLRRAADPGDGALSLRLRTRQNDFRTTALFRELVARGAAVVPVLLDIIRAETTTANQYDYYCLRNAYTVVQALAESKVIGPDEIPVILGLMDSPNIQTRLLGRGILTALAGDDLHDLLGKTYRESSSPFLKGHLLHLMDTEKRGSATELLPEALGDEGAPLRLAAVQLISRQIDEKHLALLLAASADADPAVRCAILQGLQRYPESRDARGIIRAALEDPESDVRRAALYAASDILRRNQDRSFIPGVRPLLNEGDPNVVRAAAQLLGSAHDRGATPLLIGLMRTEDLTFRSQIMTSVIQALGQIADPSAREPLETFLEESVDQSDRSLQSSRVYAVQALLRISGEKAIPFAEEVMADDDGIAPQILLQTLLEIPGTSKIPLLVKSLESENRFVVARAAQGLGQAGAVEIAPRIAGLLENDDNYLRQCILEALGSMWSRETAPAVLNLLEEILPRDGTARPTSLHHARLAITALGTARHAPATDRLLEIVRSRGRFIQEAARALSLIGGEKARDAISEAIEKETLLSRDYRDLASSLARLGDVKPMIRLLEADMALLEQSETPQLLLLALASDSAMRSGKTDLALDLARRRIGRDPREANARYDLGCILALAGEPEEALAALEQARVLGYMRIRDMLVDPDLESLHGKQAFRDLAARMNRR